VAIQNAARGNRVAYAETAFGDSALNDLKDLIARNTAWANKIKKQQPNFFSQLAEEQRPEYLWIGCSDSRVSTERILDLQPGEMFVHRNIANLVVHDDLSCASVVQYAVEVLKVKHIIVCGHYGCGGVAAALNEQPLGLIDNWLRHIGDVARLHTDELSRLQGQPKVDRLCELNVIEQMNNLCASPSVLSAWESGSPLTIHGLIYQLDQGVLRQLTPSVSSLSERNT